MTKKQRILLAFSGGLDTSAIVPWLKEVYNAEVVAYCSDLGNAPDGEKLAAWAKELGAVDFIFEDLKKPFVEKFIYPVIRSGAIYQDDYLLGTAVARPLISERSAHFAKKLGCSAIAHGATGKGNDQLRFERSWTYLAPDLDVIAPWKIWDYTGRSDLINYMSQKGFEMSSEEKVYSEDVNLLHRSCEGGILEDPGSEFDTKEIFDWVKYGKQAKTSPKCFKIQFENGIPVALDGKALPPVTLFETLNKWAGEYGVGVVDLVEARQIGMKSRGIYETPGGTILFKAVTALKHLCWDRALLNGARAMSQSFADLIYDGYWHTPLKTSIDAFFEEASRSLTGEVTLELGWGQLRVLSRQSEFSLYNEDTVSFEKDDEGWNKAALGYCQITNLGQKQLGQQANLLNRANVPTTSTSPTNGKSVDHQEGV